MGCSLFSSICGSLCAADSCSISFGGCCNSTTIIVGQVQEPIPLTLSSKFQEDLFHTLDKLGESAGLIQMHTVTALTQEDVENWKNGVTWGILAVAKKYAMQLGRAAPSKPQEEGYSRFQFSAALCGIDVEGRYSNSDPLSAAEEKLMQSMVETVERYGSRAAYLWKLIKENQVQSTQDLETLYRNSIIPKKTYKVLSNQLPQFFEKMRSYNSFSLLEQKEKQLFFHSAKHLSKKTVPKFVLWTEAFETKRNLREDFFDSLL